jgi:hypothetical protein
MNILRIFLLPVLLLSAIAGISQDITGSWETYRNEEFMQFNIEQRNNELCGYSYDYELYDKRSYCKANFKGRYDSERKFWYISGTGFIANSGSHVLMRIIFWRNDSDPKNVLRGKVFLQSSPNNIFGMGGDDVVVRKVSDAPVKIAGQASCFPPKPKPAPQTQPKVSPPISKTPLPVKPKAKTTSGTTKKTAAKPASKPPLPSIKKEQPNTSTPVIKKIEVPTSKIKDSELLDQMTGRRHIEQSRLQISVNKLNLKLYDNGTVDGDTVSVFYNGKLLLSHQRLTEKPIDLTINLDENTTIHEITLYAENLGSIVPNTALIIVTAGDKRYELRSKANLEENAVLVFEYTGR